MKTLCQDCLRVVEITQERYTETGGDGLCPCGGDLCGCVCCLLTIKELSAWNWPNPFNNGMSKLIYAWTPETGIGENK